MEQERAGAHQGQRRDSRAYDLLMASPLILFCGFALAGFAILIPRQVRMPTPDHALIATEAVTALFLALQLVLVCVRRLPLGKASGLPPKFWGFVGANFGYAVLLLPRVSLGPVAAGFSAALVLAGTVGSIGTLLWLGRGFAILPQARVLVTTGPYAYIRHPLYLFEQLAVLGVALQYRQPWALVLFALSFAIQFPRMRHEEAIMRETFAGYDAYARATPRLVPFALSSKRPQ